MLPRARQPRNLLSVPGLPESEGVFYKGPDEKWVSLAQISFSGTKTSGMAKAMINPIGMPASKFVFEGGGASTRIKETMPVFYIRGYCNPPDVHIFSLTSKKDHREIQTDSGTLFNMKTGVRDEDKRPVTVEKVAEQICRVKPTISLAPGEYLLTTINQLAGSDFGIDIGK